MFRTLSLCLCLLALTARADEPRKKPAKLTAQQKKGWAAYDKDLKAKQDAVNKACGTSVKSAYDKASYPAFDPLKDRTQSACQAAVGTLAELCRTPEGKESVKESVSRTTCLLSTEGTKVSLEGGELRIHIDPEKSTITGLQPGGYSWKSALEEVL